MPTLPHQRLDHISEQSRNIEKALCFLEERLQRIAPPALMYLSNNVENYAAAKKMPGSDCGVGVAEVPSETSEGRGMAARDRSTVTEAATSHLGSNSLTTETPESQKYRAQAKLADACLAIGVEKQLRKHVSNTMRRGEGYTEASGTSLAASNFSFRVEDIDDACLREVQTLPSPYIPYYYEFQLLICRPFCFFIP